MNDLHERARDEGIQCADWLHDLVRSGSLPADAIHRRVGLPSHVLAGLMGEYTSGPKGRLARARMLATGTHAKGDDKAMWLYTTGAPDGVLEFIEKATPGIAPNAWVKHAHTALARRWWTLYPDQH